jgi:serine/threonine protein phosphatase 1
MTHRIYAIGDIHGQLDMLRGAHDLIAMDRAIADDPDAQVVHIGDLVDRGPDSRSVIDVLMNGQARGAPWVVIKGNHDRLFTRFVDNPDYHDPAILSGLHWLHPRLGGNTTLASYGVTDALDRPLAEVHKQAVQKVPTEHLDYINGLPVQYVLKDLWFVHAGIRPGIAAEDQVEDDLLWIRAGFLDDPRDHGALVVHGHTAMDDPQNYGNRLNIDSGAGYGRPMTVVVIEGRNVWRLTPGGRQPLCPTPNT